VGCSLSDMFHLPVGLPGHVGYREEQTRAGYLLTQQVKGRVPNTDADPVRAVVDMMQRWMHSGAVVVCLVLAACSVDTSQELLETAEFEERQHNVVHAKQLYEEIIRSHPSSPQAETARARLAALK
jgi:hypothetical protein